MSESLWQIIGILAGCVTTAMTLLYGKERRNRLRHPDRIEALLDGYEKLIRDNDRKGKLIDSLEESLDTLKVELNKSQGIIQLLKEELGESRAQINDLNQQLLNFKQKSA